MLAVSHDRYFINRCFGKLWSIDHGRFSSFSGNYEYYKEKQAERAAQVQQQAAAAVPAAALSAAGSNRSQTAKPAASKAGNTASAAPDRKPRPAIAWEQDIADAESVLAGIDAQMMDPQAASDAQRLAELHAAREAAQQKLDDLYSGWLSETES